MKKFLFAAAIIVMGIVWTSCKKSDNTGQTDNLTVSITADNTTLPVNQTVTFTVKTNSGTDVSNSATYYVDGVAVSGRTYSSATARTVTVKAVYSGKETNSISVTFTATVITFNKRVLIEDFTGTWCQYCPRVAYSIEQVKAQTTDAVITAIHRSGGSATDPYHFAGATPLLSLLGITGYPTGQLNRTTTWTYPEPSNVAQAVNLTTGTKPRLGLAMTSTAAGNNVSLTVKVKFGDDFSNLRLVVYAVEDGLVYNQTNSTSYYGGVNPIVGFVHDNVLRAVLTNSISGDDITGPTTLGSEYTKAINYTVPAGYQLNNMHFVAFVINSSNAAINSRDARLNVNQNYEIE